MGKKRHKSRLDAHAEQLELWLQTMDYRAAAKRLEENRGVKIHWTNLARWHKARAENVTLRMLQKRFLAKGDLILAVTRDLIESEWAKQIVEFKVRHDEALKANDPETATRYAALWNRTVMGGIAHFFPKPPDVLVQQQVVVIHQQTARRLLDTAERALQPDQYAVLLHALEALPAEDAR